MKRGEAIALIYQELEAAELKHPLFPTDPIHAVGILVEESGEAMQAALDFNYAGGSLEHLEKELAQAGAMAIRNLINLQHFKKYIPVQVQANQ